MNRATQRAREIADQLLSCEPIENRSETAQPQNAFSICEKLRVHLSTMMGNTGVNALLSRALALAKEEAPSLRGVHLSQEGRFEEVNPLERNAEKERDNEGAVLLTHLLGLLLEFIGEKLTLRMVQDALPEWPLNDSNFDTPGKNEKAK